jgi:hypothetical protein
MKRIVLVIAALLAPSVAFAADTIGKQPTKLYGADGTTVSQISVNNTAPAGGSAGAQLNLPAIVQSALPTYSTNGNFVGLTVDASGRLYVTIDSTVTVSTNVKQINGTTADTNTGNASAGTQRVVIASNQPTLAVTQGAPSGIGFNRAAPVNIAAAGTTAIVCKSGLAVSQPTKVYQITITGGAAARCTLRFNDNATMTNFADVETSAANPTVVWTPPSGFIGLTTSSTVTTLQYEANCNNFDAAAQDIGCAIAYCQAASGC